MLGVVLNKQKELKSQVTLAVMFIVFISIYTLLDIFNGGYQQMMDNYGLFLPIINIIINIVMAGLSAFMMSMSILFVRLSGNGDRGSYMSIISVIFGVLTYGCTSCVIAFFAALGITFSVAILPFAGLPYKLISLMIVIVGTFWLLKEIKNPKCKRKK